MNKFHSLSLTVAVGIALTTAIGTASAYAGELFDPQNSDLTQSVLAPGSRSFIAVDDETAVAANERYVSNLTNRLALFTTKDRHAIAQWLAWAERERPAAFESSSQPVIHQANAGIVGGRLLAD